MPVDLTWLRAEAVRLGLPLTEEDLMAIRASLDQTRTALAAARLDALQWDDPPVGVVPPPNTREESSG